MKALYAFRSGLDGFDFVGDWSLDPITLAALEDEGDEAAIFGEDRLSGLAPFADVDCVADAFGHGFVPDGQG